MVKHFMIALLCAILTSFSSADVVNFKIKDGIDPADYD